MRSKSILISECHFKENSPIVGNFDYDFILPFIQVAQDIDVAECVGQSLLTRIQQGVIDADLNADETILLEEYIQPALVHYAMFRGMNFLAVKPDNSGLVRRDSENGTSIDMNETSFLADKEKNVAESYGQRLKDYLTTSVDLYPEYGQELDGQIDPTTTPSYSGGMWLGLNNDNCNTL